MPIDPATHVQVFRVDLPPEQAAQMLDDPAALETALGVVPARDRIQLIDPSVLAGIGLANYLAEGEGIAPETLAPDKTRLDQVRTPVLLLLPGATPVGQPVTPVAPLTHLGDYPLVATRGAEGRIETDSARGQQAAPPPEEPAAPNEKRQSGMVAMVALAVALLIALIMVIVAA